MSLGLPVAEVVGERPPPSVLQGVPIGCDAEPLRRDLARSPVDSPGRETLDYLLVCHVYSPSRLNWNGIVMASPSQVYPDLAESPVKAELAGSLVFS